MRTRTLGQASGSLMLPSVLRPVSAALKVKVPRLRIVACEAQATPLVASTSSTLTLPANAACTAVPALSSATTSMVKAFAATLVRITPEVLPAGVPVSKALKPPGAVGAPVTVSVAVAGPTEPALEVTMPVLFT